MKEASPSGGSGWQISADGTRIATSSWDRTTSAWDDESCNAVGQPLIGDACSIECVAVSKVGTRIVSGSLNGTLRVWDAQMGDAVGYLVHSRRGWMVRVAVGADDSYVVSVDRKMEWL